MRPRSSMSSTCGREERGTKERQADRRLMAPHPQTTIQLAGKPLHALNKATTQARLGVGVRVLPHKLLHAIVPARRRGTNSRQTGTMAGSRGWWAGRGCKPASQPAAAATATAHDVPPPRSPLAGALADERAARLVDAAGHGAHGGVQAAVLAGRHGGRAWPAGWGAEGRAECGQAAACEAAPTHACPATLQPPSDLPLCPPPLYCQLTCSRRSAAPA